MLVKGMPFSLTPIKSRWRKLNINHPLWKYLLFCLEDLCYKFNFVLSITQHRYIFKTHSHHIQLSIAFILINANKRLIKWLKWWTLCAKQMNIFHINLSHHSVYHEIWCLGLVVDNWQYWRGYQTHWLKIYLGLSQCCLHHMHFICYLY